MNEDPKTIEHIPNEQRPSKVGEWVVGIIIIACWVWYFYFRDLDWISLALGAFTGGVIVSWVTEITGNKAPDWMVRSLQSGNTKRRS